MRLLNEVEVYLDEGLGEPELVGILRASFGAGRRLSASSFEYASSYLQDSRSYALSPDLPLVPGRQYSGADTELFGAFDDVSPEDWGAALIDAAYADERDPEQPRAIGAFDHLVQLNDVSRMGAIRLKHAGEWLTNAPHSEPRVADAHRLAAAAARFEVYESTAEDLELLGVAGSSLGGARPKVNIRREDGSLWILKLPSNRDRRVDIEAWEAVALEIAGEAGLDVPPFELIRAEGLGSSLLVKRFDRVDERRVGYISAMSAMSLGRQGRATYADFADTVDSLTGSRDDLRELFGRIALTLLVRNLDDHWKNHGFVREGGGWRLSPLFDVNPTRAGVKVQARPINDDDNPLDRDISLLAADHKTYGLTAREAAQVFARVVDAVKRWREFASRRGISAAEVEHMSSAFDERQRECAEGFIETHLNA
ncbi:type II toxin-antitoxin system HipA family toxin [Mycetocola sp. JXN-3]|uniref:type II toxin-antitoxin system HipA family toxin n=1 Tax=Mycetocola sp. JXN-3 TaxID=2116510 RepID=UPI00165D05C7|nr:HipA domain-containing protein [Mycetocola sp. JXN-3]